MSVEKFRQCMNRAQIHPNDAKWMPVWLSEYAKHLHRDGGPLEVTEASVLAFLRSLRDRRVPAWQRLQAARSVEWYQALVLRRDDVDFAPFKLKLGELADVEKRCGEAGDGSMPGEGQPGTSSSEMGKDRRTA